MKKVIFLAILALYLFTACGKEEPETYSQAVLPAPDRIVVNSINSNITYEPGSENYEKLCTALSANWWLTGEDGTDLKKVTSLKALKTTSDDTMRHSAGDIILLIYEQEPLAWYVTGEERLDIRTVGFVVPEGNEAAQTPVKGCFLVSQTEEWGNNEGLYTYFYPPEIANGLWEFLKNQ